MVMGAALTQGATPAALCALHLGVWIRVRAPWLHVWVLNSTRGAACVKARVVLRLGEPPATLALRAHQLLLGGVCSEVGSHAPAVSHHGTQK